MSIRLSLRYLFIAIAIAGMLAAGMLVAAHVGSAHVSAMNPIYTVA